MADLNGLGNLLKGKNRLLLMGAAILWIMAFHVSLFSNLLRFDVVSFLFGKGYLGVDVFFFFSSYGLCFSLNNNSLSTYYLHRVKKLLPLYLVYLAVFLLFFRKFESLSWYDIVLLQLSGGASFMNLNIEWFVPALILLYIVFPALFRGVKTVYKCGLLASLVLILGVFITGLILSSYVNHLFSLRFPIIILGILTYLAIKDENKEYLLKVYLFSALLGLCSIGQNEISTGSLIMPVLLFVLGNYSSVLPSNGVISWIGSHTLEIYLAQNLAFNHFMATSDKPFLQSTLISFGIVILGTFLFYLFQDRFYSIFSGLIDLGKKKQA